MIHNLRRKRWLPIFFLCLITFGFNNAFSQTINTRSFEHLTKENGLPSNTIYQTVKDKNGFIWIATSDGLVRFDGTNQRVFKHDPAYKRTISGNKVRSLLYDNQDRLWVGTVGNGLNIYNHEADYFQHFSFDKNNPNSLSNNDVLCIFQDSQDRIWVGTEQGINLFNPRDSSFRRFLHDANNPRSVGANAIIKIFEDSQGRIWLGTWDGGLNLVIPQQDEEFSFLSIKEDKMNPYSISSNHIWDFVEDDNQRIWLGTFDGGLVTFDIPDKPLNELTAQDFKFQSFGKSLGQLDNNRVFALTKDKTGDIWVGTLGGIGIFSPNKINIYNTQPSELFHTYLSPENEDKTIPHNEIRDLYFDEQQETVWVSTFGGVGYHFMSKQKLIIYPSPIESQPVVTVLQPDNSDFQYFGFHSKGIAIKNNKTNTYQYFEYPSKNANYNRIRSMTELGDSIWIGSQAGLSIFDKNTKKLSIVEEILDANGLKNCSVKKIFQDSKKRVWLATSQGLIQTNRSLSASKLYQPDTNNPQSISNKTVTDIEEDNNGNFWVVTCGGGLNKLTFDKEENPIFQSFASNTRSENFPATDLLVFAEIDEKNETIWIGSEISVMKYLIKEDRFINNLSFGHSRIFGLQLVDNNIWLANSDGLIRYDIIANRVSNYIVADGIVPVGFYQNAYSYDEKSKFLFFGGINGYQYFNPVEIVQDDRPASLLITDFKIFNQSLEVNKIDDLKNEVLLEKNITDTKTIDLSYLHTSISISITPMDFQNANRYLYAYKLEGLENDWVYTSETEISYSRLPHGDYNFVAKAKNSDGFWSPPTELFITVAPPFWKRMDFMALVGLLFIIAGIWLINNIIKRVSTEKEHLENLVLDTSTALPKDGQEHLSAEDILRDNKLFFEKLYFESPLGIAFADKDFNIIKCNDKFSSIFAGETVKNRQIFDMIADEKTMQCQSLVSSLIEKQEKTFREDLPYQNNSQMIWLNTAFSFLYDDQQALRYAIIKVSDVTDRKEKEQIIDSLVKEIQGKNEELEQKVALRTKDLALTNNKLTIKNEELARFAHIASHDLKEPLRNISSFAGLINLKARNLDLPKEILESLHFIQLNTHQMHTIIKDVLEYSKFDTDKYIEESVDLIQTIEDVKVTLSNFLSENNAQIITTNLPSVLSSNRGFLFLLLKNLINNGIKYNESETPTIEISCMEEETQYIFKIKDNGIGIDEVYFEQIFTMFKRLHTREKYKGSGLGLALCKRIVARMNGELTVESEVGKGSVFTIFHPKNSLAEMQENASKESVVMV